MKYLGKSSVSSFMSVILKIAWYAAIAGALILASVIVYFGLVNPQFFANHPADGITLSSPGLQIEVDRQYAAAVKPWIFLGGMGVALLSALVALFVLHQLRRIFDTLVNGEPFCAENAGRIRRIGFAVIVGAVVEAAARMAVGLQVMNLTRVPGIHFTVNFDLSLATVFLGLVLLILSEVFRRGAEIQEEQRMTV